MRIQFQQDEVQHELRRDNLCLTGLPEGAEETEEELTEGESNVAKEVGLDIWKEDISSS